MAIALPLSPTLSQVVSISGVKYTYTANGWKRSVAGASVTNPATLVGTYATAAALQAAFPATVNAGRIGLVGASAPYTEYKSDGVSWNSSTLTTQQTSVLSKAADYNAITGARIKRWARSQWMLNRLAAGYGTLFTPNTGTVIYIDPAVAGSGTGTLTDPFNAIPATVTNGNTYLMAEKTSVTITTTARTGAALGANTVWGTYERMTGRRLLTDPSRLATFSFTSAAASAQAFNLGVTNTNVTFSGLRLTCPDVMLGDRRAIYASTSSVSVAPMIEYCIFDGIDSRTDATSVPPGAGIFSFSDDTTVRFCTFRNIIADAIWIGYPAAAAAGGRRPRVYGNDIILPQISVDGPDGIQLNPGLVASNPYVTDNWIELSSNQKQCLISSGSGYALTDTGYVARNVMWGPDLSTPRLGVSNSKTCEWQAAGTVFESNIIRGGQYGLNASMPFEAYGNLFVADHGTLADASLTSLTAYYGLVLSNTAGHASVVSNNTFVRIGTTAMGTAIHQTSTLTSHVMTNNIVLGKYELGIRRGNTATETNNCVYGPNIAWANSGGTSQATGTGGVTADPQLDYELCPKPGSPVVGAASASNYKTYTDVHGYPARKDLLILGAAQAFADAPL
jgi:hypothetical protein